MDLDGQEVLDARTEFRRPMNEASGRKYRRRSPSGGSSSSSPGGSPSRKHSLSPVPSKKDNLKSSDDKEKRDDIRSYAGRSNESCRHSDRNSPRGYNRHGDHDRRERRGEDYSRSYHKSSSRFWRDPQEDLDCTRSDKEYSRSRHHVGHRSKNRDSYDRSAPSRKHADLEDRDMDRGRDRQRAERNEGYGRSDHKKGNRDHRSELSPANALEESSRRNSGQNLKEDSSKGSKEQDGERLGNKEKRSEDHADDIPRAGQESIAKKSKFSSPDGLAIGKEVNATPDQAFVTDADIDAAKLAAMKAAELVNRNLVGTGYMSADQKKKLLWGNKKSNTTEESASRWDTTQFMDRDRQEKFNKLMGVKGDAKVDLKSDNPEVEKQREQLQMELEKQYTAGLRRRDGRTVGLGL